MAKKPVTGGALQLPMFLPETDWKPPTLDQLPSSWNGARVALDTETKDPHIKELGPGVRRGGYIVGYSFAIEDGPDYYIPIRHEGGDNVEWDAMGYLRSMIKEHKEKGGTLVGANFAYDMDYLIEEGCDFDGITVRDVQVAESLIDELQRYYNLNAIAERRGLPGKDETLLTEAARAYGVDPKGSMWRLPGRYAGQYGSQDARLPLLINRRQERDIDEQDLWRVYNLESRLLHVLVRMRRRGVLIDQDRLAQVEEWSLEEEAKALAEINRLTGVRVGVGEVWKAAALAPVLDAVGIHYNRTPKTGAPSITKELLAAYGSDSPAMGLILRARRFNKLRTTFAASIRRHMTNGRIHCTFNQTRTVKDEDDLQDEGKGARYGRLSCDTPNLQQQPGRDPEITPRWRGIYRPEPGAYWSTKDYSQQEPRWATHFAEVLARARPMDWKLQTAIAAAEQYRNDPDTDNHQMMADLAGIPRKAAKEIYLGLSYGMGGAKLARKLSLPTKWIETRSGKTIEVAGDEAQALLDKFDERAGYIKRASEIAEGAAKERGYVTTIGGRRCRFPLDPAGNPDFTYRAFNRIIQGSSGDQTKEAVVALDEAGCFIQLQVHDEVDSSDDSPEQSAHWATIMKEVVPCNVPHKIDIELGESWGEAREQNYAPYTP